MGASDVPDGAYSTDALDAAAAILRRRGWSDERIATTVYRPFILQGPAAWSDTWGAPRYGPGSLVRTHEGQDVFCRYGAPVLAVEAGAVEFDTGLLGGKVARLYRDDGSYWYYAHLSDWNGAITTGSTVEPGDVIGFCGTTGNAVSTPPHVHFGWYTAAGEAMDPMTELVGWLRTAEARVRSLPIRDRQPRDSHDPQSPSPQELAVTQDVPADTIAVSNVTLSLFAPGSLPDGALMNTLAILSAGLLAFALLFSRRVWGALGPRIRRSFD